jgi:hypothetical protein
MSKHTIDDISAIFNKLPDDTFGSLAILILDRDRIQDDIITMIEDKAENSNKDKSQYFKETIDWINSHPERR